MSYLDYKKKDGVKTSYAIMDLTPQELHIIRVGVENMRTMLMGKKIESNHDYDHTRAADNLNKILNAE